MASESFIRGGKYYGPGAGLVPTGDNAIGTTNEDWSVYVPYGIDVPPYDWDLLVGDYNDPQSIVARNISAAAAAATTGNWNNISAHDCRIEYQSCQGRRQYRDLVMILDVQGESGSPEGSEGW